MEEARQWAIRGYRETAVDLPGIAWNLEEKLREMAQAEKDFATVTAYRALEFFHEPSLQSYLHLPKAAEAASVWPVVRAAALNYLEQGQRPDLPPLVNPKAKAKRIEITNPWPLPVLEIGLAREKYGFARFPDVSTLIVIAIQEKRNDDVVRLHEGSVRNRLGFESSRNPAQFAQAAGGALRRTAESIRCQPRCGVAAHDGVTLLGVAGGLVSRPPVAGLVHQPGPAPGEGRQASRLRQRAGLPFDRIGCGAAES